MSAWKKRCSISHLRNNLFTTELKKKKKKAATVQNAAASFCKHTADACRAAFQEDKNASHCAWITVFEKKPGPLVRMRRHMSVI